MLNQIVIVGRLVSDPKKETLENGKEITLITLAVPRCYKNANGVYDTDFIPVVLWSGIAENTCNYCLKGDIIGVRGRIQVNKENIIEIVAEKVSFLPSRKGNEEE